MIIKKIHIKKFRGFENVEFDLGSQLTVIAGQNGTQKTTILGMLSQPFTISKAKNPMKDEKPLSGGSFKSAFSEKFKLSDKFDLPKEHEWTLDLYNDKPFVAESIAREKGKPGVRFWRKGTRERGAGYIQLPVIFLSLKRLMPIGEDEKLDESRMQLTEDENKFFKEWHKKILISPDDITTTNYLESPDKTTLGINTKTYDWKQNSAGQDNIGKILLAVLSFRRLHKDYPNDYKGGILAIDEIDATLYPAAQIELFNFLRKYAARFKLQTIFTTHSLSTLEQACALQEQLKNHDNTKDQVRVIHLQKMDNKIVINPDISINSIKHKLDVTIEGISKYKINAFTEDKEAAIFAKAILKRKASKLRFINCTLSCGNLIDLTNQKVPSFVFPNSIIFLDGDIRSQSSVMGKIKQFPNYVVLPTKISPERIIAHYLNSLSDHADLWQSINQHYSKQICFRGFTISEIDADRQKAKDWFKNCMKTWGSNAHKVFNSWIKNHPEDVEMFIKEFTDVYNNFAKELGIEFLKVK